MIGAEFKTMKSNSYMFVLSIILLFYVTKAIAVNLSSTLELDIEIKDPGCDIQVPSKVSLGVLTRGKITEHNPVNIFVSCPDSYKSNTSLIASVDSSLLVTDNQLQMVIDGKKNGTILSFKQNGNLINLTGDNMYAFCTSDVNIRKCSITPVTDTHSHASLGVAVATVNFKIIYK